MTLTDSDIVTVDELTYLSNVSALVERTPARTLQNYVVWRFMMPPHGEYAETISHSEGEV